MCRVLMAEQEQEEGEEEEEEGEVEEGEIFLLVVTCL